MADVATELHALEGYFCEFGISLVEGGLQVGCHGGDCQDAAAGGDDPSVFDGGAGVEDDYVFALTVNVRKAGDGIARGVFAGVASAGGDDADAGAGTHLDGELIGRAVDGCVEEINDVGFE